MIAPETQVATSHASRVRDSSNCEPSAMSETTMMVHSGVPRIQALDFTKGALVLTMVLYHWLNYFVGTHGLIYRYLRFLPPSFIFITGFLVSNIYLQKYDPANPALPKRLAIRGLKILAIFSVLNCIIKFVLQSSTRSLEAILRDLVAVYITGNIVVTGVGKAASFYILVPISYVLLLSAAIVVLVKAEKYAFHVVCALLLVTIFILSLFAAESATVECLAAGFMGVACGYMRIDNLDAIVRHRVLLLCAYGVYLLTITVREVNFPLQIVGVCLSLLILYMIGNRATTHLIVRSHLVLLGKYSLFAYIAQIVILQVLRRGLRADVLSPALMAISFLLACGLTAASVIIVDRARVRSTTMNTLYKAVFA